MVKKTESDAEPHSSCLESKPPVPVCPSSNAEVVLQFARELGKLVGKHLAERQRMDQQATVNPGSLRHDP
jgi:hypothetical protein